MARRGLEPTADEEAWAWARAAAEWRSRLGRRNLRASDWLTVARSLGYVKMSSSNEFVHILEHRIGTAGTLSYTCRDSAGAAVDLSEATVTTRVRDYPGGEVRDDVTFATPATGTAAGLVTQAVAGDELDLPPGDYALTFHTDGNATYPPLGSLILRLRAAGD